MIPWLHQLLTAPWRRGESTTTAAALPAPALSSSETAAKPDAEHLIFMVHGLFGTRDNWRAIRALLEQQLDRERTVLFISHCNERQKTFDGIDMCGERLAAEIQAVAAQHPGLRRISILAHSMGGLISRYAIGRLYDPATRTVAGLAPCHFVAIATPHLGCDTRLNPAQVPLINWLSAVPAVGGAVHTVVSGLAAPVSSIALGRAGLQFFFMDAGKHGTISSNGSGGSGGGRGQQEPLLYRLSQDRPQEGLLFLSALAAFETRTLYANSSGDHLVGWANSSLRQLHELPPKNGRGTGVVREDPLEFAWRPEQRPALHATPAAAELHSGEAHRVSREAILQAHTAEELVAGSSSGRGSMDQPAAAVGGQASSSSAGEPGAEPQNATEEAAALAGASRNGDLGSSAAPQVAPAERKGGVGTRAGLVNLAASAASQPVDSGGSSSSSSSSSNAQLAAAGTAAAQPGSRQMSAVEERLEEMLSRLQALGWRRVDVCFAAAPLPFLAHQHIQQQRVINWPGQATVKHLALQLAAMEQLRAQRRAMQGRPGTDAQPADVGTAEAQRAGDAH